MTSIVDTLPSLSQLDYPPVMDPFNPAVETIYAQEHNDHKDHGDFSPDHDDHFDYFDNGGSHYDVTQPGGC